MEGDSVQLLDTPKRSALDSQASNLRIILKDFERNFAAEHDGKKPSKDDIKADSFIASKYKEYNKIRDVLAGKLSLHALDAHSSPKRKRHSKPDAELDRTPRKRHQANTPRKLLHAIDLDPYDAPASASPHRQYLSAIGPTPHRDGKVLGLFDLLATPSSRGTETSTPSSNLKMGYRKDTEFVQEKMEQTPKQRKRKHEGDILEYLTGTPHQNSDNNHQRHSRTPASEGKRFLLSQLFATPSAARYSEIGNAMESAKKTPLRDLVLGTSPQVKRDQFDGDATPGYLRRSISFKDRLLSASQSADNDTQQAKPGYNRGPPTLRHFRSAARSVNHHDPSSLNRKTEAEVEDEDEDEMEALREMESNEINTIAREDLATQMTDSKTDTDTNMRVYKKKGQKRTTRKTMMRPTVTKTHTAPTFVAADGGDDDDDDDDEEEDNYDNEIDDGTISQHDDVLRRKKRIKRSEGQGTVNKNYPDNRSSGKKDYKNDDQKRSSSAPNAKWDKVAKEVLGSKSKSTSGKTSSKTVNPNAYSHMNFRTLKIKNKNSKAKGAGRGRFGRGRR